MSSTHSVPDDCPLTAAQFAILQLVCEGMTYEQIALERGSKPSTVRTHLTHIFRRLGVHTQAQAVSAMFRRGWFDWSPPASSLPPFLQAYLEEFDMFLDGNGRARHAMRAALVGARISTAPRHRARRRRRQASATT